MGKKLNTEEFILKAIKVHGMNKFDYSKVKYESAIKKITIWCKICCEWFSQLPYSHLNGHGCDNCGGTKNSNIENFIKKSNFKHGNKYSYTNFIYKGSKIKSIITCLIHGDFEQAPNNHLRGQGCPLCYKSSKLDTEKFIEKSKKIHGCEKYNYEKVYYKNNITKVKIFCIKCNAYFMQIPNNHLRGSGCLRCSIETKSIGRRHTRDLFIFKSQQIYDIHQYDYSKVKYSRSKSKVEIFCNKCKNYFYQKPGDHLSGYGCPICNFSKGELKISKILKENNIKFEIQKKFIDCKNKYPLPFDFYLQEYNILIEFDGEQHFKPIRYTKNKEKSIERFKQIQANDNIKTYWCKENNLPLIRISYKENLEEKINKLISFLQKNIL